MKTMLVAMQVYDEGLCRRFVSRTVWHVRNYAGKVPSVISKAAALLENSMKNAGTAQLLKRAKSTETNRAYWDDFLVKTIQFDAKMCLILRREMQMSSCGKTFPMQKTGCFLPLVHYHHNNHHRHRHQHHHYR